MNKTDLFIKYAEHTKDQTDWIDRIPSEISTCFFDNPLTESYSGIVHDLLNFIFTQDEKIAMFWWLYEWETNNDLCIVLKEQEFKFENLSQYVDYLVEYEGWEKPTITVL